MNKDFRVTIRIDGDKKKQIETSATLDGISVSDFIRNAIISYKGQKTIEALQSDIKRIDKNLILLLKICQNSDVDTIGIK